MISWYATHLISRRRDHSGYGLSQWETTLQCNDVSHWLSPYPEWSVTAYVGCVINSDVQSGRIDCVWDYDILLHNHPSFRFLVLLQARFVYSRCVCQLVSRKRRLAWTTSIQRSAVVVRRSVRSRTSPTSTASRAVKTQTAATARPHWLLASVSP